MLRAQRDLGVDIAGRPGRGDRRLRGRHRPGRPGVHRRPRAGHPARREGPDRGVQRARRPRARPQGDDQPRPHRERRAAADRCRRSSWSGTGSSPRWCSWPGSPSSTATCRWPGARTTWPRRRPRSASGSRPRPTSCWSPSPGSTELIARYPLRGIKGPMGTAQDMLDLLGGDARKLDGSSGRWPPTSASADVFTGIGQVYPRSLDFDVRRRAGPGGGRAVQPGHHDPADGRPRAGHRGLQPRARSAPRRCRTR